LLSSATALASAFHPPQERGEGGAHNHPIAKTPSSCAICGRPEKCPETFQISTLVEIKTFLSRLATVCLQIKHENLFSMILSF
jgi:hypothetical protein